MARHFRAQLEQEIAAEELAKQKHDLESAVQSSVDAASSPINTVTKAVEEVAQEITPVIAPLDPLLEPGAANGSGHAEYDPANDPHITSAPISVAAPAHDPTKSPA
jgi:hypothetical protein